MADDRKNPSAGGFILACAILLGTVGGVATGEPSAGLLVGVAVGVAAALLVWLRDRRA